jgi:hypothetical protein
MVAHVTKGRIHAPAIVQMMRMKAYECNACTDTDEDLNLLKNECGRVDYL